MDKKKHIVYLVNHLKFHGGIEKLVASKIDAWIEIYGYKVTVITLSQGNAPLIYPTKNNFELIDLAVGTANNYSLPAIWKYIRNLSRILKKIEPDFIIATVTGIPSLLLPLINRKIKKVVEFHTHGAILVTKSWKYKWWLYNKYDYVAISTENEKKFLKLRNTVVIPNFVESQVQGEVTYRNREKKIITAGRLDPQKQLDHLVKAWEKIYKKHPDWSVNIYGQGDKKINHDISIYINDNNIERIKLLPPTKELDQIMQKSSIYCLTSWYECFPMVLLQCKYNMIPALSYETPNGPRQIISDDGIIVEHNNINQFALELSKLIADESLRNELARNAYKNRVQFSPEVIMKKWHELL